MKKIKKGKNFYLLGWSSDRRNITGQVHFNRLHEVAFFTGHISNCAHLDTWDWQNIYWFMYYFTFCTNKDLPASDTLENNSHKRLALKMTCFSSMWEVFAKVKEELVISSDWKHVWSQTNQQEWPTNLKDFVQWPRSTVFKSNNRDERICLCRPSFWTTK